MIRLRGMTWKHTRGLSPMVATAVHFRESHPAVTIEWESRTLSEFGEAPVEALAEQYDFVVLDHPYMGALAHAGCFLPLDEFLPAQHLEDQAEDSVGPSHRSYQMAGHHWALAIDAASQIAGWRPDLLEREGVSVPKGWDEVFEIARIRPGFVSLPLWPLDTLMVFFTLCANAGSPAFSAPGHFAPPETAAYALDLLRRLRDVSVPGAMKENPIAVWERMSSSDDTAYCPLAFGYSNYARPGFRSQRLTFGLIPSAGAGPVGATLGGAGLAISAHCAHRDVALEYARWVSGRECQRTLYAGSGGQPGRKSAWLDDAVNALALGYFRATLPVLEQAWLRPRFDGFVSLQNHAAGVLARFLQGEITSAKTLQDLDTLAGNAVSAAPPHAHPFQ